MKLRRFRLKSGRCNLRIHGEVVKLTRGEVVEMEGSPPDSFMDQFEELFPDPAQQERDKEPDGALPDNFTVVPVDEENDLYDVIVTETGEKVNDQPISKLDAHALAGYSDAMNSG